MTLSHPKCLKITFKKKSLSWQGSPFGYLYSSSVKTRAYLDAHEADIQGGNEGGKGFYFKALPLDNELM